MQQYGGFAPGQRVFARTPKLLIDAVDKPRLKYFISQNAAPVIQTQEVLVNQWGFGRNIGNVIPNDNSI